MHINEEMAHILREMRVAYFGKTVHELKLHIRFFYALSGSFIYFAMWTFVQMNSTGHENIAAFWPEVRMTFYLPLAIIGSVLFAWLAAALDVQRGPVRLYLAGLILPAITMTVVQVTVWPLATGTG